LRLITSPATTRWDYQDDCHDGTSLTHVPPQPNEADVRGEVRNTVLGTCGRKDVTILTVQHNTILQYNSFGRRSKQMTADDKDCHYMKNYTRIRGLLTSIFHVARCTHKMWRTEGHCLQSHLRRRHTPISSLRRISDTASGILDQRASMANILG
jgi:hypothetical protein